MGDQGPGRRGPVEADRRGDPTGDGDRGRGGQDPTVEPERGVGGDQGAEGAVATDHDPRPELDRAEQNEGVRHQPVPEDEGEGGRPGGDDGEQPPHRQRAGLGWQRGVLPPADPGRGHGHRQQDPGEAAAQDERQRNQPGGDTGPDVERHPRRARQPVRGDLDRHVDSVDPQRNGGLEDPVARQCERRRLLGHPMGAVVVPGVASVAPDRQPVGGQLRVGAGRSVGPVPALVEIGGRRPLVLQHHSVGPEAQVRLALVADDHDGGSGIGGELQEGVTTHDLDVDGVGRWGDRDDSRAVVRRPRRVGVSAAGRPEHGESADHRRRDPTHHENVMRVRGFPAGMGPSKPSDARKPSDGPGEGQAAPARSCSRSAARSSTGVPNGQVITSRPVSSTAKR